LASNWDFGAVTRVGLCFIGDQHSKSWPVHSLCNSCTL
jgi:hypothetical protein